MKLLFPVRLIPPVLCALLSFVLCPLAHAANAKPLPQIERVLIISVDGLRPDVLLRAEAPNIEKMYRNGAFTFWSRSTMVSLTLPTHVSMLTGVIPERHSIMWNSDLEFKTPVYPRYPTLFELAKKAGYSTAMICGKDKFDIMDKPGAIDFKFIPKTPKCENIEVVSNAVRILRENKPQVTFIHFPGVDVVGHAIGWGTPQQLAAITEADRCVGQVLATLDELKLTDSTLVILTSDHGGAGRMHGAEDARSRHTPWIAMGPGVRKNYDLTQAADLQVEVFDTFGTACAVLGITPSRPVVGKYISAIAEPPAELLQPTTRLSGSAP
jgi:predicted AlkP superfamily pyrophosphatase or phosphodiesterase